ncbi:MAG: phosphotransferase [Patescibacteria group bacterium]
MTSTQQIQLEQKAQNWFKTTFPYESFNKIEFLKGGQTNICILINDEYILKMFNSNLTRTKKKESNKFFLNNSKMQNNIKTNTVIGVYPNDPILESSAVLIKYIKGQSLGDILYTISPEEQNEIGIKIGLTLQSFNNTYILNNQEFDTGPLLQELINNYNNAIKNIDETGYERIFAYANSIIENYQPKLINTNLVTCHNDAHLNNFIINQDCELFMIDFDKVSYFPPFMEAKSLFNSCVVPESFMTGVMRERYRDLMFIDLLKSIISTYPDLIKDNYEEVKIILLTQILERLAVNKDDPDFDIVCEWSTRQFSLIFESNTVF